MAFLAAFSFLSLASRSFASAAAVASPLARFIRRMRSRRRRSSSAAVSEDAAAAEPSSIADRHRAALRVAVRRQLLLQDRTLPLAPRTAVAPAVGPARLAVERGVPGVIARSPADARRTPRAQPRRASSRRRSERRA